MPISCGRPWKLLIDKKMNRTGLKKHPASASMRFARTKNEIASTESPHKICLTLKCEAGDIMEPVDEEDTEQL